MGGFFLSPRQASDVWERGLDLQVADYAGLIESRSKTLAALTADQARTPGILLLKTARDTESGVFQDTEADHPAGGDSVIAEKTRPVGPSQKDLADLRPDYATTPYAEPPSAPFLSDADVIARIGSDDEGFQFWLNGFEWGLIEGAARQRLDVEQLADLAAQVAISRMENQAEVRATIPIDVLAARETARRAAVSRAFQGDQS